jgi:hypothetical protein
VRKTFIETGALAGWVKQYFSHEQLSDLQRELLDEP